MSLQRDREKRVRDNLRHLYGAAADDAYSLLVGVERSYRGRAAAPTEDEVALITYADSILGDAGPPLQALARFCHRHIGGVLNTVHVLPFYPWDTDRGFSIQDYYAVHEENGTWEDFSALGEAFDHLMVDVVLNHASLDNPLVQGALTGNPSFRNYVVRYDVDAAPHAHELAQLARPRSTPPLTRYYLSDGGGGATFDPPFDGAEPAGWVWTTFSRPDAADGTVTTRQVDLNFSNPEVLREMLQILLFYRERGSDWIRLDAAGYIWKELGTASLHHANTHRALQVLHDMTADAGVLTIAEVNEPQATVLPYLGTGSEPESDLVYQFAHFPLAVQAVLTGNGSHYSRWVESLRPLQGRQFITLLGSHDGMGRKPVIGLLPDEELDAMVATLVADHGALPNYAQLPGGEDVVYELCATPWSLVNRAGGGEPLATQVDRYCCVAALGLALRGVPGIYLNGLLGMPNRLAADHLDENRTVNRERYHEAELEELLKDPDSRCRQVLDRLLHLIEVRRAEPAFSPSGPDLEVLDLGRAVVGLIVRPEAEQDKTLLALTNVSDVAKTLVVDARALGSDEWVDLLAQTHGSTEANGSLTIQLAAYQSVWLRSR